MEAIHDETTVAEPIRTRRLGTSIDLDQMCAGRGCMMPKTAMQKEHEDENCYSL